MLENRKPYDFPTEPMEQAYDQYTAEDFEVWKILYDRQMEVLPGRASEAYFAGLDICGFSPDEIPHVETVNEHLRSETGWSMFIVPGLIADKPFFEFLANKQFPVTTWLRKKEELEYLEEPDMFHDVFGHVPLLSKQDFVDFIQSLAEVALRHIDDPDAIELMSRLYWFTVEFGLIREHGDLRIYGAGIMSSSGESVYSVEDESVPRHDFDVRHIFRTPYYKHDFQKQYFVIDGYEQLYRCTDDIEPILKEELARGVSQLSDS